MHLWSAHLDVQTFSLDSYWSLLSADEQQRARRFVTDTLQQRFILAHGVLRELLGQYVQQAPAQLRFSYSEKGKPYLTSAPSSPILCFNMSHTHDQALYAFAHQPVGVDIEQLRDSVECDKLTRLVLSDVERSAWAQLPEADKRLAFFRTWTRKEALLKASGLGLAGNMRQLQLPLSAQPLAIHHCFTPIDVHPWTLYDLPQRDKILGCWVTKGIPDTCLFRRYAQTQTELLTV